MIINNLGKNKIKILVDEIDLKNLKIKIFRANFKPIRYCRKNFEKFRLWKLKNFEYFYLYI